MENKFDAILKEIRTNKTTLTIKNPRSEIDGIQNSQPLGSKSIRSNGVHESNIENSDTEDEDVHPLRASEMHELRNPARPIHQNIPNINETIVSNEDSEEGGYHKGYLKCGSEDKSKCPLLFAITDWIVTDSFFTTGGKMRS